MGPKWKSRGRHIFSPGTFFTPAQFFTRRSGFILPRLKRWERVEVQKSAAHSLVRGSKGSASKRQISKICRV